MTAAAAFGKSARIPTLWLYAQNDSYFAPDLSEHMVAAFRSGSGKAEYHLLPPSGTDGHMLINSDAAIARWAPIVDRFLAGGE